MGTPILTAKSGPWGLAGQTGFALVAGLAAGAMFGAISVLLGAPQQKLNLEFLLLVAVVWGSGIGLCVGALAGLLAKASQVPRWKTGRQRRTVYAAAAAAASIPLWLLFFLNTPDPHLETALPLLAIVAILIIVSWIAFPKFEHRRTPNHS